MPTYFIKDESKIISADEIMHFNFHDKAEKTTPHYLPEKKPLRILITSGASCPDALVEQVIEKIISFFPDAKSIKDIEENLRQTL